MAGALIASDTAIRNIKPGDPRKRVNDGEGLYLLLFVKGGAHGWRFDYSIHSRRKTLSLDTYPDSGLKLARTKANGETLPGDNRPEASGRIAEGLRQLSRNSCCTRGTSSGARAATAHR